MNKNKLYNILDLVEEIELIDKMLALHSSSKSKLMFHQYQNKKMKLMNILIDELLQNHKGNTDVMYLIKKLVEKFYKNELNNITSIDEDINFRKIAEAIS